MADSLDINIKNFDNTGASSGKGTSSGFSSTSNLNDPKAIKKLELAIKELEKNKGKEIAKEIKKVLTEIVKSSAKQQDVKLSKDSINSLIKGMLKNSDSAYSELLSNLTKVVSSGQKGVVLDKSVERLFRVFTEKIIKTVESSPKYSNVKINIDNISSEIDKSLKKLKLSDYTKDISELSTNIKNLYGKIERLYTSIDNSIKSGGKVDISEITSVLSDLKSIFGVFKKFGDAIKDLRSSSNKIAYESKEASANFKELVTELRKDVATKVTNVRGSVGAELKKSPLEVANTIVSEIKKLEPTKGSDLDKFVTKLEKNTNDISSFSKQIGNLGKILSSSVKSKSINTDDLKEVIAAFNKISSIINNIPKVDKDADLPKSWKTFYSKVYSQMDKASKVAEKVQLIVDDSEIKKITSNKYKTKVLIEADKDKFTKDITEEVNVPVKLDYDNKLPKEISDSVSEVFKVLSKNKITPDIIPDVNEFKDALKEVDLSKIRKSLSSMAGKLKVSIEDKKLIEDVRQTVNLAESNKITLEADLVVNKKTKKSVIDKIASDQIGISNRPELVGRRNLLGKNKLFSKYKERVIKPDEQISTGEIDSFGTSGKSSELIRNTNYNLNQVSKSLKNLQTNIVLSLEKQFEEANNNWTVIRPTDADPSKAFSLSPSSKQWTMKIVNLGQLRKSTGQFSASVDDVITAFKSQKVRELSNIVSSPTERAENIGKWLKAASNEQIKSLKKVETVDIGKLLTIKETSKGQVVGEDLINAIKKSFGEGSLLENIFRKTFAESAASRSLMTEGAIKKISIPAAKTTVTGSAAFSTVHGSERSLPKFATFETGFENLYSKIMQLSKIDSKRDSNNLKEIKNNIISTVTSFSDDIKEIGVHIKDPTTKREAAELSTKMLTTLQDAFNKLSMGKEGYDFIRSTYSSAAEKKGFELQDLDLDTVDSFISKVDNAAKKFDALDGSEKSFATFIKYMEEAGLTTLDVVKSLSNIKFSNVYDIMNKILTSGEGISPAPVTSLGKTPYYDRPIREFEKAVREVENLMPIVDRSKPRRGYHQENVINLLSRSSELYSEKDTLQVDEQKTLIKDLNIEINELLKRNKQVVERQKKLGVLPNANQVLNYGISSVTSLGVPESQAGDVKEYRKYGRGEDKYLKSLQATSIKLSGTDLTAQAPFQQFQQAGRNISGVTNAMVDLAEDTKAELPKLRSEMEKALVESGRYSGGYGYNVTAELRTTASNFEDQIVIAGKLAKALTSAAKTLVTPSPTGAIGGTEEEMALAAGVTDIKAGKIGEVTKEYMKILGVPKEYKGRADEALIEDVKKTMTVVRGKDVEVQTAQLAETFLNYFGRKFVTRYGSKGVSVTPSTRNQDNLIDVLSKNIGKPIKVDQVSSLGSAIMPKTMGEMAANLFSGDEYNSLRKKLIASGNKFIIDLFHKTGEGAIVIESEAKKTAALYTEFSKAWQEVFSNIPTPELGTKGIEKIKNVHELAFGKKAAFNIKPIDVRISSYGAAKRGLQTEFLESMMSNVAGTGKEGFTTMKRIDQTAYTDLLGAKGERGGSLKKYASALGYTGTEKSEEIVAQDLFTKFGGKGSVEEAAMSKEVDVKEKALLAKRAAAIETATSFYSDIVDEFGKKRKGFVGEKFLQIIEEPHKNPEWQRGQIERGTKGARLNLPAYSAYASVFGEQSAFMDEIKSSLDVNSKKHWEYLKALQAINDKDTDEYNNLVKNLKTVSIKDIKPFSESTGVPGRPDHPRSFSGTVLDIEKFPGPFKLELPTGQIDKLGKAITEEFYVPGAAARGTYPEPLLAGEHGMDQITRRLTHVIDVASKVGNLIESPAEELDDSAIEGKLRSIIGDLVAEANTLVKSGQRDSSVESRLEEIISKLSKVLSTTNIPRTVPTELSEFDFVKSQYMKQMKKVEIGEKERIPALATTIGDISDVLIGKGSQRKLPQNIRPKAGVDIAREQGYLPQFAEKMGVDVVSDELSNKVKSLQKAKIDYYNSLAEAAMGKSGSINELFFSRKIPAIMGKAITAVVDKRDDIRDFREKLNSIESKYGVSFGDYAEELGKVFITHSKAIVSHKKAGLPVLKQAELGIPKEFASKIPLEFTKKFKYDREEKDIQKTKPEKVSGTLYDLLRYTEMLRKRSKSSMYRSDIEEYIENELVPYVESIRFPFTGTSSIAPFKPKLINPLKYHDEEGTNLAKNVLIAPGIPEGLEELTPIIDKFKDRLESLVSERETLQTTGAPQDEINNLTSLIRELNAAISNVIPKYTAQAQKLDFDGDQIEIHAAKTVTARKDIAAHFKKFHVADPTKDPLTADVFRTQFLSEAADLSKIGTTGEYVFGESQRAFEKKFPTEKGFEYLKTPFLTDELEYLSPEKSLDILKSGKEFPDVQSIITQVLEMQNIQKDTIDKIIESVNSVDVESENYTENLMSSIREKYSEVYKSLVIGLKTKLKEEKISDTVEAALFKIHTGTETEALYRVHRLAEGVSGFGGGEIGKAPGRSSDYFKKRYPTLPSSGGRQEEEFHTMINEMVRFGIQKGMDVKHAGEKPVAGEMVSYLTKGEKGADELWKRISDKDDKTFGDLRDFSKASEKSIKTRMGSLSTSEIMEEAKTVATSRGEDIDEISVMDRERLVSYMVKAVGFEGFITELALLIKKEAIDGLISQAKQLKPGAKLYKDMPKVSGDVADWAKGVVEDQISKGGINIRQDVTAAQSPLYSLRTSGASTKEEYRKYSSKFGNIRVPEEYTSELSNKELDRYNEKYRKAKAVASNIQRELNLFSKGDQGGAYAEMLRSTSDTLYSQQNEINAIIKDLTASGYDPEIAKGMDVFERMSGATSGGLSNIAERTLALDPGKMEKRVDQLSERAGIPAMSDIEKLDISKIAYKKFAEAKRTSLKSMGMGRTEEEIEEEVSKYVKVMESKAIALKQLDRVIDAFISKKGESFVISDMMGQDTTTPNIYKSYTQDQKKLFDSFKETAKAERKRTIGTGSFVNRQDTIFDTTKTSSVTGGVGVPKGPAASMIDYSSKGPIPVHIVSADPNVTINVKGLESLSFIEKPSTGIIHEPITMEELDRETLKSKQFFGEIKSRSADAANVGASSRGEEYEQRLDFDPGISDKGIHKSKEAQMKAAPYKNLSSDELDRFIVPPDIVEGSRAEDFLSNLKLLHDQAKLYQKSVGIGVETLETLSRGAKGPLTEAVSKVTTEGPDYKSFIDITNKLNKELTTEEGVPLLSQRKVVDVWKIYRAAVGDYLLKRADDALEETKSLRESGDIREATKSYGRFQSRVTSAQEFMRRSIGKKTDIYTQDKRFVSPSLAQAAGVYMSPEQIMKKAGEPLGEDDQKLIDVFKNITKGISEETEVAPVKLARSLFADLSDMDNEMVDLLSTSEKLGRMGTTVIDAWDFDKLSHRATRLRAALQQVQRNNKEMTAEQVKGLDRVIKYLKKVEDSYGNIDLSRKDKGWGEFNLRPVDKMQSPYVQEAMHGMNIKSIRETFERPQEAGGPDIGQAFSYTEKVVGDTGEVVKNVVHHFKKYGEVVLETGEKVGKFSDSQVDLIDKMQSTGSVFGSAIKRVITWGAASRLVYGGISNLKSSLGELSNIELGITSLRTVMNPLETDFNKLSKSATGFAKQYGVPVTDVLKSMKVFAQQGLKQGDVVDRTQTATLASNVTTLDAKDATEALTAAMKVFREEGSQSLRFLDAWSEVESKHAITADDMANAIKKSAAAAKSAGVTFDQLNGIVASIGSVTRQSGKEIGTSLRFIFRRLFSEEGPKALAKLNIPVLQDTGELRSGFEVLNDLSGAWKDLSSAQKMNVAQSIGGTRQYNSLLVLMDQWDETLRGIRNSTNSKGSAERRNLEIMKTYAKQLEKTKAAASELKMEVGKIVLPAFKTGLKGIQFLLETFTAIPAPIKLATTALAGFFTLGAKGINIFESVSSGISKGSALFGNLSNEFSKQMKIAKFEVTGKPSKGMDVSKDLLKYTVTKSAADKYNQGKASDIVSKVSPFIVEQGKSIDDFQSSLGKMLFLFTNWGRAYNKMIGNMVVGTGKLTEKVGETGQSIGSFLSTTVSVGEGAVGGVGALSTIDKLRKMASEKGLGRKATKETFEKFGAVKGLGIIAKKSTLMAGEVAGAASYLAGQAIDTIGEKLGAGGHKILKEFATQNAGLVKSLAPLALTIAALIPTIKAGAEYFGKMAGSARDFENSMSGARRKQEDQLKSVRGLIQEYDTLNDKIKDIQKVQDPVTKSRRQELGTYEAPLTSLQKLQKRSLDLTNNIANSNVNLVVGYDKLGNAILRTSDNYKGFLRDIESLSIKEGVFRELDVLGKYIDDLTEGNESEKVKVAFKELAEAFPVVGELLARNIKVSPAKSLELASEDLNKKLNLKQKYPLSSAADEDIKRLQGTLNKARDAYQETYSDMINVYSGILSKSNLRGLTKDDIENVISSDELRKAYEMQIKIDPRFKLVDNVTWKDVMGKELLTALNPETAGVMDVVSEFTKANLETAGIKQRSGKAASGDILTFYKDLSDEYNIAGQQAILKLKDTDEWVVEYFNTKTLKIEEKPLSEVENMVDSIFPLQKIKEDLSYRMESLNTFVAGASAGLSGISKKDFKRDFNLGSRFFGDIPTTTLLQGGKGFTPTGGYGDVGFMKDFQTNIREFYFKPMEELNTKIEQVSKLKLEGLESGDISIAKGFYEEIKKLTDVLKNNQVVFQFAALVSDLMKEMSTGQRVLMEDISIMKQRSRFDVVSGGLAKGAPLNLDVDFGARSISDLSTNQKLLSSDKGFRELAIQLKSLEMTSRSNLEMLDKFERAYVQIEDIAAESVGFGAVASPERMRELVDKVVPDRKESAFVELKKVDQNIETNTATTVDRLDKILENLGDSEAIERQLSSWTDKFSAGAGIFGGSSKRTVEALERVAGIRKKAESSGDQETVIAANKSLDILTKKLVSQAGYKEGAGMVGANFTLFSKKFTQEEFQQRALGGVDTKVFVEKLKEFGTVDAPWYKFWQKSDITNSKAFKNFEDAQQKQVKETVFSSKNMARVTAVASNLARIQQSGNNEIVSKIDDQIKALDARIEAGRTGGAGAKEIKSLVTSKEALERKKVAKQSEAEFYGAVKAIGATGFVSTELAKSFGLTETQIKALGVSTMGLYAAFELASKVIGDELPEDVKEFRDELTTVGKKLAEGEKFGVIAETPKLRAAGKRMTENFAKRTKAIFGEESGSDIDKKAKEIDISKIVLDVDKSIEERKTAIKEFKNLGENYARYADIKAEYKESMRGIYSGDKSSEDIKRLSEDIGIRESAKESDFLRTLGREEKGDITKKWKKLDEQFKIVSEESSKSIFEALGPELEKTGDLLVRGLEKAEAPSKLKQAIIAYLSVGLADYTSNKSADKTNLAETEKIMKKQSASFAELIRKYPEAAEAAINDLTSDSKTISETTKKMATIDKPLVLDVDKQKETIKKELKAVNDYYIKEQKKALERRRVLENQLHNKYVREDINRVKEEYTIAERTRIDASNINRRYSLQTAMNKELTGYSGDVELPLSDQDMSTQKRIYKEADEGYKKIVDNFAATSQQLNAMVSNLERLKQLSRVEEDVMFRSKDSDAISDAKKRYMDLNEQMNIQIQTIDEFKDSLNETGKLMDVFVKFKTSIYQLKDALKEVGVQEAVERLPGMRDYRESISKLLGGGHPEAATTVSVEESRMGARVGKDLQHLLSTRYEVQEAQILDKLRTATGEEATNLRRQLTDLPQQRERDIQATEQEQYNEGFRRSLQPYEEQLVSLERIRTSQNITGPMAADIEKFQIEIVSLLKGAKERLTKSEFLSELETNKSKITPEEYESTKKRIEEYKSPYLYRGVTAWDKKGLSDSSEQIKLAMEKLIKDKPSLTGMTMKTLVTSPIVGKLSEINNTLKTIGTSLGASDLFGEGAGYKEDKRYIKESMPGNAPTTEELYAQHRSKTMGSLYSTGNRPLTTLEEYEQNRSMFSSSGISKVKKLSQEVYEAIASNNPGQSNSIRSLSDPSSIGQEDIVTSKKNIESIEDVYARHRNLVGDNVSKVENRFSAISEKPQYQQQQLNFGIIALFKDLFESMKSKNDITQSKAFGGMITGPGGPKEDKIPAWLSNGEYVINASSANKLGLGNLNYMNKNGKIPGYADGGIISAKEINQARSYFVDEDAKEPSWANPESDNYNSKKLSAFIDLYKSKVISKEDSELMSFSRNSLKDFYNQLIDYEDEGIYDKVFPSDWSSIIKSVESNKKNNKGSGFSLRGGVNAIVGKGKRAEAMNEIMGYADGGLVEKGIKYFDEYISNFLNTKKTDKKDNNKWALSTLGEYNSRILKTAKEKGVADLDKVPNNLKKFADFESLGFGKQFMTDIFTKSLEKSLSFSEGQTGYKKGVDTLLSKKLKNRGVTDKSNIDKRRNLIMHPEGFGIISSDELRDESIFKRSPEIKGTTSFRGMLPSKAFKKSNLVEADYPRKLSKDLVIINKALESSNISDESIKYLKNQKSNIEKVIGFSANEPMSIETQKLAVKTLGRKSAARPIAENILRKDTMSKYKEALRVDSAAKVSSYAKAAPSLFKKVLSEYNAGEGQLPKDYTELFKEAVKQRGSVLDKKHTDSKGYSELFNKLTKGSKATSMPVSSAGSNDLIIDLLNKLLGSQNSSTNSYNTLRSIQTIFGAKQRDMFESANKYSDMVFHNGGVIPKTGRYFMEGGEVVIPKNSKEIESNNIDSKSLTINPIKIDASDIIDKLESLELKVEDKIFEIKDKEFEVEQPDWKIEVDPSNIKNIEVEQPDWKIKVDVPTEKIDVEVDLGNAANVLSQTIKDALNTKVQIEVPEIILNKSAGADRMDELARAVDAVNDKILNVNKVVDDKINIISNKETSSNIEHRVINLVSNITEGLKKDISDIRTGLGQTDSYQRQFANNINATITEIDYAISNIKNNVGIGRI